VEHSLWSDLLKLYFETGWSAPSAMASIEEKTDSSEPLRLLIVMFLTVWDEGTKAFD